MMTPAARMALVMGTCAVLATAAAAGAAAAAAASTVQVRVDLTNAAGKATHIREQFLSTTIDVSLLTDNPHCDLDSETLRNLASELTPVWLRVGGTKADKLFYDMSSGPYGPPPAGYEAVLNQSTWNQVNEFAKAVNMSIVFGINGGPGPRVGQPNGSWSVDNAMELLKYSAASAFPIVGYEFANEPDLFATAVNISVQPAQFAVDVNLFAKTIKALDASLLVITPDVDYIPVVGDFAYLELLALYLHNPHWDVATWHFYPTFAPEHYAHGLPSFLKWLLAKPELLMNTTVLDQVGHWASSITHTVRGNNAKTELWLGETGSAVGGGAANVSDVFVAGFEWLDKLGQMAAAGQQLVFRQTLCGYRYGLIGFDLMPNPDYWTSVLFKRLVGTTSLGTTVTGAPTLRAYSYCSRDAAPTLVITLLNLSNTTAAVLQITDWTGAPLSGQVGAYMLTSADGTLTSRLMKLNGQVLSAGPQGTLPPLKPVLLSSGDSVTLPASAYGFLVFPSVTPAACV